MIASYLEEKKTKIIATLGPTSLNEETLKSLIVEGTDIFRFNASHNSEPKALKKNIKLIRKLSKHFPQLPLNVQYSGVLNMLMVLY